MGYSIICHSHIILHYLKYLNYESLTKVREYPILVAEAWDLLIVSDTSQFRVTHCQDEMGFIEIVCDFPFEKR